jgi:hypothetical protein
LYQSTFLLGKKNFNLKKQKNPFYNGKIQKGNLLDLEDDDDDREIYKMNTKCILFFENSIKN